MRLHNRQIKAGFWTDDDILDWPMPKRVFYLGLIQLADDSGCLEDRPRSFRREIFRSDLDIVYTTETVAEWVDELVDEGKIVRYTSGRKDCLFLMNFHKHQKLKNPSPPEVPLPVWITWEPYDSNQRTGKYSVDQEVLMSVLQGSYTCLTDGFQPNLTKHEPEPEHEPEPASASANAELDPDLAVISQASEERLAAGPKATVKAHQNGYSPEFEQFWQLYPRQIDKAAAWKAWQARLKGGGKPDEMIAAARHYRDYCAERVEDITFVKHPSSFLGPTRPFEEFVHGPPTESNIELRRKNGKPRGQPEILQPSRPDPPEQTGCEKCGQPWQEWPGTHELYCSNCEPHGPPQPVPKADCGHVKEWNGRLNRMACPRCELAQVPGRGAG